MRNIWIIASREYKRYFTDWIPYTIAFVFLLVIGIFFYLNLQVVMLQPGYIPSVEIIIAPLATMLVLITPAVTTRLLAEEQRLGTIELLLTAPVRDWELIVGKWLGGLFLLLSLVAVTLIYPLILNQLVQPGIDQGPFISGYLGIILLSAALIAIGVAISSFFSNQIAAFIATLGVFILLWWILDPIMRVVGPTGGNIELIQYLNFSDHLYANLLRGIIDLRDVVYYSSITALSLFIGTISVEVRRWR
jgi:ABC-2 type transport system permease protein